MDRIRDALASLAERLGLNRPLLARAERRHKANRARAFKANKQKEAAQDRADELRKEATRSLTFGNPAFDQAKGERLFRRAERKDKKALRLGHVAYKNSQRAQFWLGRVKALTQRIHGLETRESELRAELKKLSGVTIKGDKATGGTARERLKAVALASAAACASGKRRNFYSQPGSWNVDDCITGENYGERSDCSQWVTAVYKSAGLKDPNGTGYTGGYTGTLVANGKQISRSQLQPGDLVIYGSGTAYHVELFVGPGDRTIGHGDASINAGVVDLFGNGDYRCFSYV